MIHFTTFFVLLVGGMEVIQPAGALAGLLPRRNIGFQRRQGSGPPPPPGCVKICNQDGLDGIVSNIYQVGFCAPETCCANNFITSFYNCFKCVGDATHMANYTSIQGILDNFYGLCKSNGYNVTYHAFPGQNHSPPNLPPPTNKSAYSTTPHLPSPSPITQTSLGSPTPSTPAAAPSTVSNVASPPTQSLSISTPYALPTSTPAAAPTKDSKVASPPTQSMSNSTPGPPGPTTTPAATSPY